jgi:hypothetical protein
VIAVDEVVCKTLTKAEFGFLLKGIKGTLMNRKRMRSISDQQALGRKKLSTKGDSEKEDLKRRITTVQKDGFRDTEKAKTFLRRMLRFMTESMFINIYRRMYREMLIVEKKSFEYGDIAIKIMTDHSEDPEAAVAAIRKNVMNILGKEPDFRSQIENRFIAGLMHQKNEVTDKLCTGWAVHQCTSLWKNLEFHRIKPSKRVSLLVFSSYLLL